MASKTESLTITNSKKKVATSSGSTVYYNFYSTNSNYGVKGTIDTLVREKIPKYSTISAASLTAKFSDGADLANIYYNIIYGNYGSS